MGFGNMMGTGGAVPIPTGSQSTPVSGSVLQFPDATNNGVTQGYDAHKEAAQLAGWAGGSPASQVAKTFGASPMLQNAIGDPRGFLLDQGLKGVKSMFGSPIAENKPITTNTGPSEEGEGNAGFDASGAEAGADAGAEGAGIDGAVDGAVDASDAAIAGNIGAAAGADDTASLLSLLF